MVLTSEIWHKAELSQRGVRHCQLLSRYNRTCQNSQANIVWLEGTDPQYLDQIMDYTDDAEHDDAPDSASVVCRFYNNKRGTTYVSPFGG